MDVSNLSPPGKCERTAEEADAKSIKIVRPFIKPCPTDGERLMIGFPMLFRYRKAMRTFLLTRSFLNDKYGPNGQEYFIIDMTKKP